MRLRIIIEPDVPSVSSTAPEIFQTVMRRRRTHFWAFLTSLVGHLVTIALLVSIGRELKLRSDESRTDWSHYRMETIHLRLAEPIFYNSERPQPAPIAAKAGAVGHRLPATPGWNRQAPIILQPDPVPQPVVPAALPALAFWARKAVDVPLPHPQDAATPGRAELPTPPPRPAARPVLAVPNREPVAADVNVAMPPVPSPSQSPAALPNSATVPILLADATDQRTGSFDPLAGRPVNVIVLAADPGKRRDVEIPKGMVNVPPAGAGAGPGEGGGAGANKAGSGRQGTGEHTSVGASNAGSSATTGARSGTANAGGSANAIADGRGGGEVAASGQASPAKASQAATNHASIPTGNPTNNPTSNRATNSEVTRVQHPPTGVFDVVIMQSGGRDDLPDLAGLLPGNPVYTVYLHVGDQKEWLLQYCEPAHETRQENPFQVNIDAPAAISPPYPITTVIPAGFTGLQRAGRIVLRGILKASGSVSVTKVSDSAGNLVSQLLSLINQWRFRPAMRDKVAIDVEVLLVIPPLL